MILFNVRAASLWLMIVFSFCFGQEKRTTSDIVTSNHVMVACYYFPNYHPGDPRNEKQKGKGWSEWNLVKASRPRFSGHHKPDVPLWGYQDESDARVMEAKIDAAADHHIDAFIFDWYYYNDGPFLNACLDQGFLKASNHQRLKFSLMWANHDWVDIMPYKRGTPQKLLYPGRMTPKNFTRMCDHIIKDYFLQPSYWKIDGKPYFSIYDLSRLLESFGSVALTRLALDRFRSQAVASGLPGIHLNAVVWGQPVLPGEKTPADPVKLVQELGFDSITSYVWVHHVSLPQLQTPYNWCRDRYLEYWSKTVTAFQAPYYPNVSMGWDPSPRTVSDGEYGNFGYPYTNTMSDNTPENFKQALIITRDRLLADQTGPRIMNINAWNEWTESSYLEPDMVHGLKYLQAIKEVFE
jgi:hypothetical protein